MTKFLVLLMAPATLFYSTASLSLTIEDACLLKSQMRWEQKFISSRIAEADSDSSIDVIKEMEDLILATQVYDYASNICPASIHNGSLHY